MAAAVDEYAMNIVNEMNREYDAFVPMDMDARHVASDSVRLHRIPFNTDLSKIRTIKFTEKLLNEVDIICCKGFGDKTGIRIVENTIGFPSPMSPIIPDSVVRPGIQPELLLLCTNDASRPTIIMIAIIVFSEENTFGKIIDITTVAKNPKINHKNTFETFLKEIKNLGGEYSTTGLFVLEVKKENTIQMTEQGRLRLYTSLGFSIPSKTPVEIIYPPIQTYVVLHDPHYPGRLVLYKENKSSVVVENDYEVFLGNIKSTEGTYIPMIASRDDLGKKRDIYLGAESCFKGNAHLIWDEGLKGGMSIVASEMKKNANVPITPFEKGDSAVFIQSVYHMSLTKKPIAASPNNNYIDYFEVPKDFIIVSFASPGSILSVKTSNEITEFTNKMSTLLSDDELINQFIKLNRSTAILPIYNIQDNSSLQAIFQSNDTRKQLTSTLMNSVIIDSLGRQPIYEFIHTSKYKKYQVDVQVYTEGMYMSNNTLGRETMTNIYTEGRQPVNKASAENDDRTKIMGSFNLFDNSQLNDSHYVNKPYDTEDTIENYLKYLKTVAPLPQAANGKKTKYVIFLFGCSSLETNETYETLYELSHRRSIVHRFTRGDTLTSEEFLNDILYNKYTNPYDEKCQALSRQRNDRATNYYRRMIRNTIRLARESLRHKKSTKTRGGYLQKTRKQKKHYPKLSRTHG